MSTVPDLWSRLIDTSARRWRRSEDWLFGGVHAAWGAAACRIGTGLSVLGLLLTNFGSRNMWVGPGSIWAEPARQLSRFPELALLRDVSSDVLTVVYLATGVAALSFILGWHTKAANVGTLIGFIAIVGQNPIVTAQGDNLVRLTLLWLLLMQTADHWSLDSRRRKNTRDPEAGSGHRAFSGEEVLPSWLTTSLHNIGLAALVVQTVLVYLTAGLDKVSQEVWQNGTALYYTLQLPEYRPFPWLSDLLSSSTVVLAVITYAVLLVQLFFAPLLLNSVARKVMVALAMAINVLFAVVFAAPWSALAVIAVTSLFVDRSTYVVLDDGLARLFGPVGDWLVERGYGLLDRLDDLRYRTVLPALDWIRSTVLRR